MLHIKELVGRGVWVFGKLLTEVSQVANILLISNKILMFDECCLVVLLFSGFVV